MEERLLLRRPQIGYLPTMVLLLLVMLITGRTASETGSPSPDPTSPSFYAIHTPQTPVSYGDTWLLADSPSVVLHLMTCTEGRLILTQTPYVTDSLSLEVVIDKDFIRVRDTRTGSDLEHVPTPNDFLGCALWRALWVSWADRIVAVGSGQMVGEGELLRYERGEEHTFIVTGFSLSSSKRSVGGATWRVAKKHVQSLMAATRGQAGGADDRELSITGPGYILFGLRSGDPVTLNVTRDLDSASASVSASVSVQIRLVPSGSSSMHAGRTLLAATQTNGLLHEQLTRFIWVRWVGAVIEVGRGMRVGDGLLMSGKPPGAEDKQSVALSIDPLSEASWLFYNFDVNSFRLIADNNLGLMAYSVSVRGRDHFRFRLRACEDATLELRRAATWAEAAPGFVRVTVGALANKLTEVDWLNSGGGMVSSQSRATVNVLSCVETRLFWFSWKDGIYRMGTGHTLMENQLFQVEDTFGTPAPDRLHLASLEKTNLVVWQFDQDQGDTLILPTPLPHSSFVTQTSLTVGGTLSLVFRLRGKRDAQLFLGRYLGYALGPGYIVYIARLTEDGVFSGITTVENAHDVRVKTPDVIVLDEERYFWVSWSGGHIELGRGGVVGERMLVTRPDAELYDVNAIHLLGSSGVQWSFDAFHVHRYSIHTSVTSPADNYQNAWLATHLLLFPFMVRSPVPVSLVLTHTPGQASNGDIEITFGVSENTQIKVMVRGNDSSVRHYPADNLLSDKELRAFWFIWYDGVLRVGIGVVNDQNELFTYIPKVDLDMNGVILNSETQAPAEWNILPESVNLVWKKTPATYGHRQLWRDLNVQTSLVFKVSAAEEAHLLLSPAIEQTDVDVLEITIGHDGNTKTIIRNGTRLEQGEKNIVRSVNTPDILNATEMRTFWTSWLNGEILLGEGSHVGVNRVIDWKMEGSLPIHAVSMCTSTTTGKWELSEVVRDVFHITTLPVANPWASSPVTLSTGKDFLQFGVVTCNSAWVTISVRTYYRQQTYAVSLGENMTDVAVLYQMQSDNSSVELTRSTLPGVVRCGVQEAFWFSWGEQNMLRLGKGYYPNKILLEHKLASAISVLKVHFNTGDDGPGIPTHWSLKADSLERFLYQSVGPRDYRHFWLASSSQNHARFSLQASGSVATLLGTIPEVTSHGVYSFSIHQEGAMDRLRLKKDGQMQKELSVPRLALTDGTVFLWLSWRDGVVTFGQGTQVGGKQLFHWKDEDPLDIRFFSVTSIDSNQTSEWGFFATQANMFEVYSTITEMLPSSYHRVSFAPLQHLNHISFQVRACKNARLALSDIGDGHFATRTHEIVLETTSDEGPTFSAIRNGVNGTNLGIVRTSGVVSCETTREFWVGWVGGLKVGKGKTPPAGEFLHYSPLMWRFVPSAVAMASGPGSDGNWVLPLEQAEAVFVRTGKWYDHFWMSVHDRTSAVFSVRIEQQAAIVLSDVAFQGGNFAYVFEIERKDGYSSIRERIGGKELVKVLQTGLLSADEYRAFWITWDSDTLRMGKGAVLYSEQLLEYGMGDKERSSFASLGIVSRNDVREGEWSFLRSRGKVFRTLTTGPIGTGDGSLTISPHAEVLTFQLRACSDVSLVLFSNQAELYVNSIVIVIGGSLNSKVEFLYLMSGEIVASTTVHNVLDCDALRPFWVSWDNSVLRFGSGRQPLDNILLSWVFEASAAQGGPAPIDINLITFAAESGTGAEWELDFYQPKCAGMYNGTACISNETFIVRTKSTYDNTLHWLAVTGETSLVFLVRACSDVHITLAAIPSNSRTLTHEVILGTGSNTRSLIRRSVGAVHKTVVDVSTDHLLSCATERPFWVSWSGNEVVAGTGRQVGVEPFIRWSPKDRMHVINSVGISTRKGSEGVWFFGNLDLDIDLDEKHKEDSYIITTPDNRKYLTSWTPANNYIMFSVRACSDALVSLIAFPTHPDIRSFELAIGSHSNTKTSISVKGGNSPKSKEVDTKGILNCSAMRHFWVQWYADTITFGSQTTKVGDRAILSFSSQEMPEIRSVSIATDGVSGTWEVPKSLVFTCESFTQPPTLPTFTELWVTTQTTTEVVFTVKACAEVYLLVGGYAQNSSYVVAIGTKSNSLSSIRNGPQGSVLDQTQTMSILSCSEYRWFWVRWYQGLEVGKGRMPGANMFLRTRTARAVRAVAFSTALGHIGHFRFRDIADDSFYIVTPEDNSYNHVWVSGESSAITFKVRACTGALIRLGEHFLDTDPSKPAYEVILDNGLSIIRRLPGHVTLQNATTPDLVNCHLFSEISVLWDNGGVVVRKDGRGIMHASDTDPVKVKAVAFGVINTGNGDAAWKFARHAGKSTVLITPSGGDDFTKWVTVSQTFLLFRLRAASDATLRLCETPGLVGTNCYEVGIQHTAGGACKSYIREHALADDATSGGGCAWIGADRSVAFWLSWKNNVVSLGLGSIVDYHVMLQWNALKSPNRHPVEAITMTSYKQDGYWEFSEVEDKVFELKTMPHDPEHEGRPYLAWLRMSVTQLKFKLKGCPTAVVLITETPGDMTGTRYEIEMGHMKSHVFKVTPTSEKVIFRTFDTPDFLDCYNYREYVLKWTPPYQDIQSISLEEVMGDNKIAFTDEFSAIKAHAVSFMAGKDNMAYWLFKEDAADVTSFETAGEKDSGQVVYKQTDLQHFIFKVKGKGPAHVILQEHYHTDRVYEFTIGAENNEKTTVTRAGSDKVYDDIADTPNILSETDFRQLWVQWSDFRVAIGYGVLPGANEILSQPISDSISIQYVALTTSMGNNGTWEVTPYPPDMILSTMGGATASNPLVKYKLSDGHTGLVFSVSSCDGFTVSLHQTMDQPANYQLTYSDRKLNVYRHNVLVHTQPLEEKLCRGAVETYWLGWAGGALHLAVGTEGGRRLVEWTDQQLLPIHIMAIPDNTQVARFGVARTKGMGVEVTQLKLSTISNHWPFNNLWYTLSGRSGLMFGVKSETGATILFTRTPGVFTHDGYEVRLSNANTTLHSRLTGEVLASVVTPHLVNGYDFSYIWADWNGGRLRVGRGGIFGIGPLFSHEMERGYDVVAASFDSSDNVTWSFDQDAGNEFIVKTRKDTSFSHAWFAPKGSKFSFSVLASQNAIVRLSVQPDYTDPTYFNLVFGAADNTGFMFYEKDVEKKFVESKGVLDRRNFRRFWLDLSLGRLRVGAGPQGESEFLNQPLGGVTISTINLGDDSISSATWKIPTDQELMARFHTPPSGIFNTHWLTVVGHDSAVLRIRGCDSARILLLSMLSNHLMPATLIDIDNNGITTITDSYGGTHTRPTPDLLSCGETRAFWVVWHKLGVEFGTGATPWVHSVVGFDMQEMHPVVAMSFASGINTNKKTTATWDIYRIKGNVLYETSSSKQPMQGVQVVPPDGSSFGLRGQVRTCGGAAVTLRPLDGAGSPALSIVYGSEGNTRSEVVRGTERVALAATPYYLHEAIDQPFWVSWTDATLTTGLGPGRQTLLSYTDPDTDELSLALFSSGTSCDAHWTIDLVAGDVLLVESKWRFTSTTPTVSLLDVGQLNLRVKAKQAAHIALSVIPGNRRYLTYEIVIQSAVTGKTCLREGIESVAVTCIDAPGLLDPAEFRAFWITWDSMTLSFGKGWSPSDETTKLLSMTSNLMPPFALVSFASFTTMPAIWELVLRNDTSDAGPTTPKGGDGGPESDGLSAGAIVGIVFGALLGAIMLGVVGVAIVMRLRSGALLPITSASLYAKWTSSDESEVDVLPMALSSEHGESDGAGEANDQ